MGKSPSPALPIQKIIARTNLTIVGIAMLLAFALFLLASGGVKQSDMRTEAMKNASILASNLADSLIEDNLRVMQNLILNSALQANLSNITVYDNTGSAILMWTDGSHLAATEGLPRLPLVAQTTSTWRLTSSHVVTPIRHHDGVVGQLSVTMSNAGLYRHLLFLLLTGTPVILGMVFVCSYMLNKRQVRLLLPVTQLSELVESVATYGDYSQRASPDVRHDLGHLIAHVNLLLARMEAWENDANLEAREKHEAKTRAQILENHDSLTKLPNRHLFHRLITNCVDDSVANGEMSALMFIDLDHFKKISAAIGYEAADAILITVSVRLAAALRNTDTLCRVDADEFAVILPDASNRQTIEALAERLTTAVSEPIILQGKKILVTASIGIACCPLHAQEHRLFLRKADLALQTAKATGRNRWHIYDEQDRQSVLDMQTPI
ncbi:MAG: diguanylate cyclase [Burkholderiales bacterium]|nr:diguanylate cyclase [Burkholderiales bacterium]